MELNIRNILKGVRPGNIQTVGFMQVIPLLADSDDDRFVSPAQAAVVSNGNYGHLNFKNKDDRAMIVPNNTMYLTKQRAQDHAMMNAGIVKGKASKDYNNCVCVQQSQGGTIQSGTHPMLIMPFSLREESHEMRLDRRGQGYGRMWPAIKNFNRRVGTDMGSSHLEYFFDHFGKELEEFVAEFEIVPKQVGAIILINGTVVGIERTPSAAYWESIWSPLVRGCYAALAIEYDKTGKLDKKKLNKVRVAMDTKNAKSIADIKAAYVEAERKQDENVRGIVRGLIDDMFETTKDEVDADLTRVNVKNNQFVGQIIKDNDAIVYASLVTTSKYIDNKSWYDAKDFKI